MLQFKINKAVKQVNGWGYDTETGIYGTNYLNRALVTAIGLGANRSQDAIYPTSLKDAEGHDYSGTNKYVIHFPKGQLPPARGFWSVTMYDANYFFVENPLNRYSISPRQNLKRAQYVHFSATNAVLSGLPLAPLPHIRHAGGQAFSTQPGAGHHVFFR